MSRSRRGEVVDCNKIEFADIQNSPIIENFSIIPQKYTQWCYASATEAVLNYHNIRVTQEMIAKWYKKDGPCSTNKNGINCPQDPIEFLEQYFKVTKIDNNDKIISLLQNPINSPIIAFVDQHYIVIVGKDEKFIYYYDPMHGSKFTSIPSGLKKISRSCTTAYGVQKIPLEYIDQNNNTLQGSFEIRGFYVLSRLAGGKRSTRRRRGSKRRAKTVRRR